MITEETFKELYGNRELTPGFIYVFGNESMPDLVKIGKTVNHPKHRAEELYKGVTGVPTPFKVLFACYTNDIHSSEAAIHEYLDEYRVNPYREFFKIAWEDAVLAVAEDCLSDWLIDVNKYVTPMAHEHPQS